MSLVYPSLHLTRIDQLSKLQIAKVLEIGQHFLDKTVKSQAIEPLCRGRIIGNLFFEPSTRTCQSFEIAAQRLGAITLSPHLSVSSLCKGETVLDTVANLRAMGMELLVIRHQQDGMVDQVAQHFPDMAIINAGDGQHQHPTQALLDLLTIQQHCQLEWSQMVVALVGDLKHSRVAHSLVQALATMGVKLIRYVAPTSLLPDQLLTTEPVSIYHDLASGLDQADVIVCLRLQKERMAANDIPHEKTFYAEFGLTQKTLAYAKKTAIVMHPGPINRQVEIASEVADGAQSVILQQARNGVPIRMAVIKILFDNMS